MPLRDINKYNIILASQSPRRQEIMTRFGLRFTVEKKLNVEEIYPKDLSTIDVATYLAKLKANAYGKIAKPDTILITADTIVCMNDELLPKPIDYGEAFDMLRKLSGKEHTVITGVCIRSSSNLVSFSSETVVRFTNLTDTEIDFYIQNYRPFDKAGAYGVQEWIGYAGIDYIKGSYYNVVGLPIQKLYEELLKFTA